MTIQHNALLMQTGSFVNKYMVANISYAALEVLLVIFHKRFYQLRAKTEYLCKFIVAALSIYFFEHKHKQNYFGNS
jgi:hypothetical protein